MPRARPALGAQIVGWEHGGRPTENQQVAPARRDLLKYDRMAAAPTPT